MEDMAARLRMVDQSVTASVGHNEPRENRSSSGPAWMAAEVFMLLLLSAPFWWLLVSGQLNSYGAVGFFLSFGPVFLVAFVVSLVLLVVWAKYSGLTVVSVVLINILSLLGTLGCLYTYLFIDNYPRQLAREHKCILCDWPVENTNEMLSQGGTLTTKTKEWPVSVDVGLFHYEQYSELTTARAGFAFFILPYPEDQAPGDVIVEKYKDVPFYFRVIYTNDDGHEFREVISQEPIDVKVSFDSKFPEVGDKGVVVAKVQSFPRAATHVELWHSDPMGAPIDLVRRLKLEKFYVWRTYLKPKVVHFQKEEPADDYMLFSRDRTSARNTELIEPAPVERDRRRRKILQKTPIPPSPVVDAELLKKASQAVILKGPRTINEVSRPE